jgi:hypothetical protein
MDDFNYGYFESNQHITTFDNTIKSDTYYETEEKHKQIKNNNISCNLDDNPFKLTAEIK